MVLRFQEVDEVDEAVAKKQRHPWGFIAVMVLMAVITGISDLLNGTSLKEYGKELGFYLVGLFGLWLVSPIYREFSSRTKEIDGKVSAIEEAVNASKEGNAELLERLTAIEEKLAEVQDARRI